MTAEQESVLYGLSRVGIVTDADDTKRIVRVKFPADDIISGWLKVLYTGTDWFPSVNDTVLTLYIPGINADGYVLGGIV